MEYIELDNTYLTPGNAGRDCLGNGRCYDEDGNMYECACGECDFGLCYMVRTWEKHCSCCSNEACPRYKESTLSYEEKSKLNSELFKSMLDDKYTYEERAEIYKNAEKIIVPRAKAEEIRKGNEERIKKSAKQ